MFSLVKNLLAASASGVNESAVQNIADATYQQIVKIVNIILPVIMSVLLVIGMYYGIILGVRYAKAEEENAKKEAKNQLVNVIVGVLIAIIFIAVVQIILNQPFVSQLFGDGITENIQR